MKLAELIAGMKPENRHGEVSFGPPVGREFPNGYAEPISGGIAPCWADKVVLPDGREGWND